MTEAEIIKALEVCVGIHNDCESCPLLEYSQATDECMTEVMNNALDLIKRKDAEIERLVKILDDKCDRCIEKERTEAVKEFAERLEDEAYENDLYDRSGFPVKAVTIADVENVKKMAGEME